MVTKKHKEGWQQISRTTDKTEVSRGPRMTSQFRNLLPHCTNIKQRHVVRAMCEKKVPPGACDTVVVTAENNPPVSALLRHAMKKLVAALLCWNVICIQLHQNCRIRLHTATVRSV